MDLYWRYSLLIVTTTAASMNIPSTHSDYYFLTHTFSELSCDPYANQISNSLALECSVLGPRITPTTSFKIVWYRTLENTRTTQNLNNFYTNQSKLIEIDEQKITVSTFYENVIVRSVLTVDLNTNNVSGEYWCTVQEQDQMKVLMFENMSVAPLTLHRSSVYQGVEACPEGAIHTAVAKNIIRPSTSSSSLSDTTSTPLTTTSSISTPTFTSTDDGQIVNSWTTRRITFTSPPTSPETTMTFSFLKMTWNIVFTVTIGVLFFVVHVLLVILGCLCCRRKQKGKSLPLVHSTTSLISSSSVPEVHRILPTTSLPIPPITFITPPPTSNPPEPESPSNSQKCSPPRKLPPLPVCSMLSSPFMHQIVVPPPEINEDQLLDEREKKNNQARHGRQEEKVVSCSISSQTKPPGPKKISLCDRTGVLVADINQGKRLVLPTSNNLAMAINNKGIRRLPDASLACLQFEDYITNKYKSLNRDMMEGYPVYEYPTRTSGEDNPAMEHTQLHRPNDAMSAERESIDGEYVLPNEFVQPISTSMNKEFELAVWEQPHYITLTS